MAVDRTAGVFAGIWLVITALQVYRSFLACPPTSGWQMLLWSLFALVLLAPVAAIGHLGQAGRTRGRIEPAIALVLLVYVPMLLAMRLLETCMSD